MRLTITGANSRFARSVIAALAPKHTIRAVDTNIDTALPEGVKPEIGDIRDRDFATTITDGADAVLHLAPLAVGGMDDETVVDTFSRGSFNLIDMAIEQGVTRFLLGSSLAMFDRLPAQWRVDENWRPRPEPKPEQLACWLSELSLRESCHTASIRAVCLRFGQIVTDSDIAGMPFDPRWVQIDDAVQAVLCGLRQLDDAPSRGEWEVYHIGCGERAKIRSGRAGGERFGYKPAHSFSELPESATAERRDTGKDWRAVLKTTPMSQERGNQEGRGSRKEGMKRRVVIFGSGGPVAAALAAEMKNDYILRQTDVRPLGTIRGENHPQSEGAPLPMLLPEPHEERTVDIRDYGQVLAACEGMDVAVNCTVVRPDAVEAFRVNTLGAFNLMKAAVQSGVRRVVQTGPQQMTMDSRAGYWWDYDVPGNAPARPGRHLYAHSKFLGEEICRLFAENYGLEIPVLLYAQFLNPSITGSVWSMAVSWEDSARALRRAVEVETIPGNYQEIVITNDLPHGKFSAERAKEILDWEAQDDLSRLWSR